MYKWVSVFLVSSAICFIVASEVNKPSVIEAQQSAIEQKSQMKPPKEVVEKDRVYPPAKYNPLILKEQVEVENNSQEEFLKLSKSSSNSFKQKQIDLKRLEIERIKSQGSKIDRVALEEEVQTLNSDNPFRQNIPNRNHATEIFISEYSEGSSNNKYVELYNPTNQAVDLSNYRYGTTSNDNTGIEYFVDFPDTGAVIAPGDVWVLAHSSSDTAITNQADSTHTFFFNGNDCWCLVKGGTWTDTDNDGALGGDVDEYVGYTTLDCVGLVGDTLVTGSSAYPWDVAGVTDGTRDNTLVRKGTVLSGNGGDWASSAGTTTDDSEWIVYDRNTWDYIGYHTVEEHYFEGFEGDFPPYGWEMISMNTSNNISRSTLEYEGSYSARFSSVSSASYSGGDYTQYMITPKLSIGSGNETDFSFYYQPYSSFYPETFMVGVSNTDSDPASFTWFAEVTPSSSSWTQHVEDLSSYDGQDVYVAIKYTANYQYYLYIDNIEGPPVWVDPNPVASIAPAVLEFRKINTQETKTMDITVGNLGGSDLILTASSSNSKFVLGSTSMSIGSGNQEVHTLTYNPTDAVKDTSIIEFTHNGASSPDTIYAYGEGSDAIFYTTFEDGIPDGYAAVLVDSTIGTDYYGYPTSIANPAGISSSYGYNSTYSYRFRSVSSSNMPSTDPNYARRYHQYLITPQVSLPADNGMEFEMWFRPYSGSYTETFQVGVSTTTNDTAAFTWGPTQSSASSLWSRYVPSLADYAGQDVYVAIKYTSNYQYYLYVDDLAVQPLPPTPVLSIDKDVLNFAATNIDSTKKLSFGVSNAGQLDLSGTVTYPTGFSGPAAFTATDSVVEVSYTPTTSGIISGEILIDSNGGKDTVVVSGSAGISVVTWNEVWPRGWTRIDNDGSGDGWDYFDADGAREGDGHVATDPNGFSDKDDWLISPKFDVTASDSLAFYAKTGATSSYYPDIMEVLLSPSGSSNPDSFTVVLDSVGNFSEEYVPFSYSLSDYAGDTVRTAIVYRGTYYGLSIDDIAGPKTTLYAGGNFATNVQAVNFGTWQAGGESSDSVFISYENFAALGDLIIDSVRFVDDLSGVVVSEFSVTASTVFPQTTNPDSSGGFYIYFNTPVAGVDSSYIASMEIFSNSENSVYQGITVQAGAIDALYYEAFRADSVPAGWTNNSNRWRIVSASSGNNYLFHSDDNNPNPESYKDTVYTGAIPIPITTDGSQWKLSFDQYNSYVTSYLERHDVSISSDGGATWSAVWVEQGVPVSSFQAIDAIDLSPYVGDTIHVAFVYHGDWATRWRIDNIRVTKFYDPILSASIPDFPATAIGDTSVKMMQIANAGSGKVNATVSATGDFKFFHPGLGLEGVQTINIDTLGSANPFMVAVHYIPTEQGVSDDSISVISPQSISGDGVTMDAGSFLKVPDANAGAQAATFEDSWIGWLNYSLEGVSSAAYGSDRWRYYSGSGHNSSYYAGVNGFIPFNGGVNDFLVSPRLSNNGDVLSFFTKGGYNGNIGPYTGPFVDSMVVWISTEKPNMGYEMEGVARVDTGFTNSRSFSQLGTGSVPFDWEGFEFDLSSYGTDVWLLIQSNGDNPYVHKIDDVAYPKTYKNPLPVLAVKRVHDFGVTQPDGGTASFVLSNSGGSDLTVDSVSFDSSEVFSITSAWDFSLPVTLEAGKNDTFQIAFDPVERDYEYMDTLRFFSNYTPGEFDAYGSGTDVMILKGLADNEAPGNVTLIGPDPLATPLITIDANNASGSTDFFWQSTVDPDGTPVKYLLEFAITGGDTIDTLLSSTNFSFEHSEIVERMTDLSVTRFDVDWTVYAYDGFDYSDSSIVWTITFDAGWVLGGLDNNTIPDVFALYNNYPNPFNPITNIKYDVPEISDVRIDIYNIAGKKVRTLVSREHQPGRYKIQWNAANEFGSPVATGMYIYKIQAKDFVSVKKLLLMK